MRFRHKVSAEPLWVVLRSDCLSVHMVAASCDGKGHSGAMRIAVSFTLYDEVVAAPRCCFVRRVVWLSGSPPVTTILEPPFINSVPAVAEPSVYVINRAFMFLMNNRLGVVSP